MRLENPDDSVSFMFKDLVDNSNDYDTSQDAQNSTVDDTVHVTETFPHQESAETLPVKHFFGSFFNTKLH